jgi:hypothetical protein
MLQVGAVTHRKQHRVKKPLMMMYKKYQVPPKKKLVEFKVSADATIPSGTSEEVEFIFATNYFSN